MVPGVDLPLSVNVPVILHRRLVGAVDQREDEWDRPTVGTYKRAGPGGLWKNGQQKRTGRGSRAHLREPAPADPGSEIHPLPCLTVLTVTPRHLRYLPIRLQPSPDHAALSSTCELEISPTYTTISTNRVGWKIPYNPLSVACSAPILASDTSTMASTYSRKRAAAFAFMGSSPCARMEWLRFCNRSLNTASSSDAPPSSIRSRTRAWCSARTWGGTSSPVSARNRPRTSSPTPSHSTAAVEIERCERRHWCHISTVL